MAAMNQWILVENGAGPPAFLHPDAMKIDEN